MAIKNITAEQIQHASTETYSQEVWAPLIQFFWDRYNKRYFDPIRSLQNHPDKEIRNNCGFLIATIDCILIETLEQYYSGKDESEGKNHDHFLLFFKRSDAFSEVIKVQKDAGLFAGLVRSGLLHQSKTKKASVINKRASTPILDWIDSDDKKKGFMLNRDKFHKAVHDEYIKLTEEVKKPDNTELRKRFKSKLATLVE